MKSREERPSLGLSKIFRRHGTVMGEMKRFVAKFRADLERIFLILPETSWPGMRADMQGIDTAHG